MLGKLCYLPLPGGKLQRRHHHPLQGAHQKFGSLEGESMSSSAFSKEEGSSPETASSVSSAALAKTHLLATCKKLWRLKAFKWFIWCSLQQTWSCSAWKHFSQPWRGGGIWKEPSLTAHLKWLLFIKVNYFVSGHFFTLAKQIRLPSECEVNLTLAWILATKERVQGLCVIRKPSVWAHGWEKNFQALYIYEGISGKL